ncbi:hypothetical protein IJG14_00210 [bacterium]|nr:hypothetical protein [bacterium]
MLKHLLNDYATLKSVSSYDEFNSPVFQEEKIFKCKFEFALNSNFNSQNTTKTKPARLFSYENDISVGDVILYNSVEYKVIQVNNYKDLDDNFVLNEVFLI